ncbi:hypothetical protein QR680_004525 [Steinernema hermaphroditum]|uniref:Uncharacterized protein n=1 Tax=Steinernema hermaphroditum TaxID=289476 RepID=A0AA39HR71_9BILA|nr:hypothetical protein QR680_004525 [Steinernema hermaphroditum]
MADTAYGLVFVLRVEEVAKTFSYWNLMTGTYGRSAMAEGFPVRQYFWLDVEYRKTAPHLLLSYNYTVEIPGFTFKQGEPILRGPVYFPPNVAQAKKYKFCAYSPTIGLVALSQGDIEAQKAMATQLTDHKVQVVIQLANNAEHSGAYYYGTIWCIAEFLGCEKTPENTKSALPWYTRVEQPVPHPEPTPVTTPPPAAAAEEWGGLTVNSLEECFQMLHTLHLNNDFMTFLEKHGQRGDRELFERLATRYQH